MTNGKWGIRNIRSKKSFRTQLRKTLTPAEAVLWMHLKERQLLGKKFRRQHSVGRYIVDFYCAECRVAIELDGARHFSITIDEYERSRTRYLEELGITIVRFENRDLLENLEGVLEKIKESLRRVR